MVWPTVANTSYTQPRFGLWSLWDIYMYVYAQSRFFSAETKFAELFVRINLNVECGFVTPATVLMFPELQG